MIGRTIGQYQVIDKIGEGGMGTVYKAEDTSLHRLVAIKTLTSSLADDLEARERFIREAQAASSINHPNITTIYELIEDESEDSRLICMEYVEGKTIRDMVETGTVSIRKAIDIILQTAEALEAAHQKEILHRDVKSANIMVTMEGRVKVMDFGLAHLGSKSHLTRTGTTLGTLAYSSPEQITSRPYDERSEIWSLGVVFHELLTGQLPFSSPSEGELVFAIMNNEPEQIDANRADITPELVSVLKRMLEKNPDERFPDCHHLISDLREVRHQFETTTTKISPSYQSRKLISAKGILLSASILVIAVVGIVLLKGSRNELESTIRLAVLPFEIRGEQLDVGYAEMLTLSVMNRLTGIDGLDVLSDRSTFLYRDSELSLTEIGRDLDVDVILTGSLFRQSVNSDSEHLQLSPELVRASDQSRLWSQYFDIPKSDQFKLEAEITESILEILDIRVTDSLRNSLEYRLTENQAAHEAYTRASGMGILKSREEIIQAIQLLEIAIEFDFEFAEAYAALAANHGSMVNWGHDKSAERVSQGRIAAATALRLAPESPLVHRDVGLFYYWGLRDLQQALVEEMIAAESLSNDPTLVSATAFILRRMGRYREAYEQQVRAHELDPLTHLYVWDLGNTCHLLGRFQDAEDYYRNAIESSPDEETYYGNYITLMLDWKGSIREAEKVLTLKETNLGEPDPLNRTMLAFWSGRYEDALEHLESVQEEIITHQWSLVVCPTLRGFILQAASRSAEAMEAFREGYQLLSQEITSHPDDPRYHMALGMAAAGLGLKEEADRAGRQATTLMPMSRDKYEGSAYAKDLALIHTLTGAYEQALIELEEFLPFYRHVGTYTLEFDPRWAPLRNQPGFSDLFK
ncbi:protein kinase [Gemmatimonadota bacterium]